MTFNYRSHNPRELAQVVSSAIPSSLRVPNARKLLEHSGVKAVLEVIYSRVAQHELHYAFEPTPSTSEPGQLVRLLPEVLESKEGTCLDLTLLIASVCLAHQLVPLVILLEASNDRPAHAILAVAAFDEVQAGIREVPAASLFDEGYLDLKARETLGDLRDAGYVFIETTGVTSKKPSTHCFEHNDSRKKQTQLDFRDALTAGQSHLQAPHQFHCALNIITLHSKGYPPILRTVRPPLSRLAVLRIVILVLILGVSSISLVATLYPKTLLGEVPMPIGEWNVAVASIGVTDGTGVARRNSDGEALGNRIYSVLEERLGGRNSRKIDFIVGSEIERFQQAKQIAEQLNASVVIFGVLNTTQPGRATFTPEIYVTPNLKSTVLYADEIFGPDKFGGTITFTLNTTRSIMNEEISRRVLALEYYVNGVKNYVAEDFSSAKNELNLALGALDLANESDRRAAAVIHEFLAATELAAKDYNAAMMHVQSAWQIDNSYARVYLTKASIIYSAVNAELQANPSPPVIALSTEPVSCFSPTSNNTVIDNTASFGSLLAIALQCYQESLEHPVIAPEVDMDAKTALGKANIYLTASFHKGGNYFLEADALVNEIIAKYERGSDGEKNRLRRLAAHAYARRGIITAYGKPQTDSGLSEAIADYEKALSLLRSPEGQAPEGQVTCKESIDQCYASDRPFIEIYETQVTDLRAQR